jgi:Bacteriocin-protection, YdeI or OmpD-Associated/Domain of unknown function (DUF1905)
MPGKVTFTTTILQIGNNTGIEVPPDAVEKLASGKRAPVKVTVNKFSYRSTLAVMGGKFLIPLSAERRTAAKIKGGEKHSITLEIDSEERVVEIPADFKKALTKDKKAASFFETLSFSSKSGYILPVTQAKTEETRQRRIDKAIENLKAGKK